MKRTIALPIIIAILFVILLSSCRTSKQRTTFENMTHPKREFRGAWLSTAWQSRYKTMSSFEMQQYFTVALDQLQANGINAVIFQARPHADAFYKSDIEPWTDLISGTQGIAPEDGFDPLVFLVEECHERNMELHAWLNPYRVTVSANAVLAPSHIYFRHPERFVTYDNKLYFDPGIPENREYICKIIKDIVNRYDVDAIHMDDYFYPYPIAGYQFPDDKSFNEYACQQGFDNDQRNDWRRSNVNTLIKEIKLSIASVKPWVRFGISPFGIYRNKKSTPDGSGSDTNGLQNYDDLFADVKLWVEKGWIDYNMPQVYWEIGHTAADYGTLVEWWSKNNFNQPLYIGQDVKRTMDAAMPSGEGQLLEKMTLARSLANIHGSCFWPAYELLDNYKFVSDQLKWNYYRYPALIPAYTHMHTKRPKKVDKLEAEYTDAEHILKWTSNADKSNPETAQYYVVYRFEMGEKVNLDSAKNIVAITREPKYVFPYEGGKEKYKYVVTAIDAFHNESKGQSKKIKL